MSTTVKIEKFCSRKLRIFFIFYLPVDNVHERCIFGQVMSSVLVEIDDLSTHRAGERHGHGRRRRCATGRLLRQRRRAHVAAGSAVAHDDDAAVRLAEKTDAVAVREIRQRAVVAGRSRWLKDRAGRVIPLTLHGAVQA